MSTHGISRHETAPGQERQPSEVQSHRPRDERETRLPENPRISAIDERIGETVGEGRIMSARGISRRNAAASGVALLVLAAAAAGQAKAEELDGELIALVREFKDDHVVVDRLTTIQDEFGWRSPEGQRAGDEISLLVKRGWEIREKVAELAAKTPEGLAAKAWLALWETCDGTPEDGSAADPSTAVAWSLARDILGRAWA
jgi:hypothetical protein